MARTALRVVLLLFVAAATLYCFASLSRGPPHVQWRTLQTREHHLGAVEWAKARLIRLADRLRCACFVLVAEVVARVYVAVRQRVVVCGAGEPAVCVLWLGEGV